MVVIAISEAEPWEKAILKRRLSSHHLVFVDGPITRENASLVKSSEILVVFIHSPLKKVLLAMFPKLKAIATMSTGFDHIDLAYCKKKKISVSNVPFYGENTVAEHAMALILAISRKIPESIERTKRGDFGLDGLRGFDVKGKTLGVIGGGHIGLHVVRMAKGFEMKVLVSDPHPDSSLSKKLGFEYVSFSSLLKSSDVISLHAPLNKFTEHMINKKNIRFIKKGAVLINTARGGLIETAALIEALDNGILSAAGLDVLEGECEIKEEKQLISSHFKTTCDLRMIIQDHILLRHPKVLITPHNAFNSKESIHRILETTVENIMGFISKKPINSVF